MICGGCSLVASAGPSSFSEYRMQHHHCNMRAGPSSRSSSMRRSLPMVRCAAEAAPTPRRAVPIQPPYNVLITGSTKGKYRIGTRFGALLLPCKTSDDNLPSGEELHSRDWFPAMYPTLLCLHRACNTHLMHPVSCGCESCRCESPHRGRPGAGRGVPSARRLGRHLLTLRYMQGEPHLLMLS